MKMNSQSRSFVKQVQVDLLALSDTDLFQIVHQWVEGRNLTEFSLEALEDTLITLGYSRMELLFAEDELPAPAQWRPPLPEQLRVLLSAMDVHVFALYVIPLAFEALHPAHPEWYDGVTFNAHLANYLRQLKNKRVDIRPTPTITGHGPDGSL